MANKTLRAPAGESNKKKAKTEAVEELKNRLGEKLSETIKVEEGIPKQVAAIIDKNNHDLSIAPYKYQCATQRPDRSAIKSTDPFKIQVGIGGEIPRWTNSPPKVKFAAYSGGYPSLDHAKYAAFKLNEAATEWNNHLRGLIEFEWVTELEDAAFVLAYGGDGGDTLASAFFPNEDDLSVLFVYQKAFESGVMNHMSNIFLHELGHVLGLRHEFAPETEGESVQVGPRDSLSVMSYNFPPIIQQSDVVSTKTFYEFGGDHLNGVPMKYCTPNN
ncbi:hypothetical protein AnigIFM56816_005069 [Aspergillus niger]|nr:hypothetical protein AnigIFM56816_005069 [Aspergillus niger]